MPKAAKKRSLSKKTTGSLLNNLKPTPDVPSNGKRAAALAENRKTIATNESQTPTTTGKANETSNVADGSGKSDGALSRGQRKRLAKRDKYLQRERLVMSSLKLKKQDEQAKRIDGLDALKEALLETVSDQPAAAAEEPSRPAQVIRSNRGKRSIVHKEVEHMKLVLEHPAFKANPLAAIHEHLKNTTKQESDQEPKAAPIKAKPKKKKSRFRATRMKNR